MFLREPPPWIGVIVRTVALVADVYVDVARCVVAVVVAVVNVGVVTVNITVAVVERTAGSRCGAVISVTAAQIEEKSGAGTAERTAGSVTAWRGTVVAAAARTDGAAGVIHRRVILAVEGRRNENSATRFPLTDRRLRRRFGPLLGRRRICKGRGSEST